MTNTRAVAGGGFPGRGALEGLTGRAVLRTSLAVTVKAPGAAP